MTTDSSIFVHTMHFRGHCEGGVRSCAVFRLAVKHLLQSAQRSPGTGHLRAACTPMPGGPPGLQCSRTCPPHASKGPCTLRSCHPVPQFGISQPGLRHSDNTRCRQLIKQLYINT